MDDYWLMIYSNSSFSIRFRHTTLGKGTPWIVASIWRRRFDDEQRAHTAMFNGSLDRDTDNLIETVDLCILCWMSTKGDD